MHRLRLAILMIGISLFAIASHAEVLRIPNVTVNAKTNLPYGTGANLHFQRTDFINTPVTTLSEFFKQQQSEIRLTNMSADPNQTALSLRGFGDNAAANSLILIDGFPLTNASLVAPNFNAIPLADIERVDIFAGSAGSLWGNQAVGGVINIITRTPKKFIFNGLISLGSYGRNYYQVLVADKAANGLYFKTFGLIGQAQNYRRHNRQQNGNVDAQLGYEYSRGVVRFNIQAYTDDIQFAGPLTVNQMQINPRQAFNWHDDAHTKTTQYQFLSKQALSNNWLLETRLAQQRIEGNGMITIPYTRQELQNTFNPRLMGQVDQQQLILGYDGSLNQYQLNNSKVQAHTRALQHDLYLQDAITLKDKWQITLGTRYAWQLNSIHPSAVATAQAINQVWVTEQGLLYQLNKELSLYLRRDGNFSFPKANEQAWLPDNVTHLQTQTGTSYETGVKWNTPANSTKLGLYRLVLHDELAFNPAQTSMQPFGSFTNFDRTLRDGINVTESYQVNTQTNIFGQINYVHARFASGNYANNFIPTVPAWNGNIGVRYRWDEHWQAQYALLYTGERYASNDVDNIGKNLAAYCLHDVSLQYTEKVWGVGFEVRNLLGKQYPSYAYYDAFKQANWYYPAPERNYLLTLNVNID